MPAPSFACLEILSLISQIRLRLISRAVLLISAIHINGGSAARESEMKNVTTAAEAYLQYQALFETSSLVQSSWHSTADDGRQLACALGALGDNVSSPRDCPAQIMPRWLAQMVPWFFDNQEFEDAKAWGLAFYAELKRPDGQVPFSVVHDWQANVVGPLAVQTAEEQARDVAAHANLADMQRKAFEGQKFTADQWRPVLKAAFFDIYKLTYRANAYADTYAYRARVKDLASGMVDCLKRVKA